MAQTNILEAYRWENRIVLLFAPDLTEQYQEQLELLQAAEIGMLERDLIIFSITGTAGEQDGTKLTEQDVQNLRDTYDAAPEEFLFILIGKDGSVKRRSDKIVTMTELFNQIDAMPMRQREMNRP